MEVDAAESVSWQSALCEEKYFCIHYFSCRKVDKLNTEKRFINLSMIYFYSIVVGGHKIGAWTVLSNILT